MKTYRGYLGHSESVTAWASTMGSDVGTPTRTLDSNRLHAPPIASCPGMAFHVFGLLAKNTQTEEHQNGKHLSEFLQSVVGRARKSLKETP
jgi:hypothetical protein